MVDPFPLYIVGILREKESRASGTKNHTLVSYIDVTLKGKWHNSMEFMLIFRVDMLYFYNAE
jgi:hypothetical protein